MQSPQVLPGGSEMASRGIPNIGRPYIDTLYNRQQGDPPHQLISQPPTAIQVDVPQVNQVLNIHLGPLHIHHRALPQYQCL